MGPQFEGVRRVTIDAPGAPFHQHLVSAQLDLTVDGARDSVDEIDVVRVKRIGSFDRDHTLDAPAGASGHCRTRGTCHD